MNMDLLTMAVQLLKLKGHTGSWAEHRLHTAYRREWKKHFGSTEFACVIHYNGYEAYTTSLLEEAPCPRSIWIHNDMAREVHLKGNMNPYLLKEAYHTYDHIVPVSEDLIQPVVSEFGADRSRITVYHDLTEFDVGDEVIVIRIQDPTEGIWKISAYSNTGYTSYDAYFNSLHAYTLKYRDDLPISFLC